MSQWQKPSTFECIWNATIHPRCQWFFLIPVTMPLFSLLFFFLPLSVSLLLSPSLFWVGYKGQQRGTSVCVCLCVRWQLIGLERDAFVIGRYYLRPSCALGSISSLGMGWKRGGTAAGVLYTVPALLLSISLHPPPGDLQIAPITVSLACL